jgi:hypothetical protein
VVAPQLRPASRAHKRHRSAQVVDRKTIALQWRLCAVASPSLLRGATMAVRVGRTKNVNSHWQMKQHSMSSYGGSSSQPLSGSERTAWIQRIHDAACSSDAGSGCTAAAGAAAATAELGAASIALSLSLSLSLRRRQPRSRRASSWRSALVVHHHPPPPIARYDDRASMRIARAQGEKVSPSIESAGASHRSA